MKAPISIPAFSHDEFIMEHYVIPLIFHNIAKNVYEHPGHNCLSCM